MWFGPDDRSDAEASGVGFGARRREHLKQGVKGELKCGLLCTRHVWTALCTVILTNGHLPESDSNGRRTDCSAMQFAGLDLIVEIIK